MTPEENEKIKSLKDRSDIFNHVVDHLRKQGTKSVVNFAGMCAYRGDGGTMCAVGALITDDEYRRFFEGSTIQIVISDRMKDIEDISDEFLVTNSLKNRIKPNLEMLMDLQIFHDSKLKYEDGNFSISSEIAVAGLRKKWNIK